MVQKCIDVLLLFTLLYSGIFTSQVYHITPTYTEQCPEQLLHCVTLSQFSNTSWSLDSNTTVIMLEGNHSLDSELTLEGISCLYIFSSYDTNITCKNSLITLRNISHVLIHHLKFRGCRFEVQAVQNFLLESSEVIGYRAAIRTKNKVLQLSQTNAIITRSFFSKVITDVWADGGIIGANESNVIITESMFQNSTGYVGVALFSERNSNITIIRSTFRYNRVSRFGFGFSSGGIFYLHEGSFTMICNSTFINNKVRSLSKEHAFDGGIIITQGNLSVTTSSFVNNFPILDNFYYQGGAIRIDGDITVDISECKFINNHAQTGGAVYARRGIVSISDSIFIANTAVESGGAIAGVGTTLNITGCIFRHNNASNGGGLHLDGYKAVSIKENDFTGNIATGTGGALYIANSYSSVRVPFNIIACRFSNNSATSGGAIHIQALFSIENSVFNHNVAIYKGGALSIILSMTENISIHSNVFTSNRAGSEGGAMYLVRGGLTDIENTFINNEAGSGGALCAEDSEILILKSYYHNNMAIYRAGGALKVHYRTRPRYFTSGKGYRDGQLNINKSIFTYNTAIEAGGSISLAGETVGACELSENFFIENSAYGYGGAVATDQTSTLIFTGNDFLSNRANHGGAIYLKFFPNMIIISKSVFRNNIATSFGGALSLSLITEGYYADVGKVHVNMSKSEFYNNSAHIAGAIYTKSVSSVRLYIDFSSCIFVANCAEMGGALSINFSQLSIYSATTMIANNTANDSGGGVYLNQSKLSCHDGGELKLAGNYANKSGGGIYSWNSSIVIYCSHMYACSVISFINNTGRNGGGLLLHMNSTLYIITHRESNVSAVNFVNNLATYGQDVFVPEDNCTKCPTVRECFFQSLPSSKHINAINFSFAHQIGLSIVKSHFGNCTVNSHVVNEIENLKCLSNIQISNIGSLSLKLCFCKDGLPDCTYEPPPVQTKNFSVQVAMVDQFNHPVCASIKIQIDGGIIPKKQRIQRTNKSCTRFNFNVFSSSFAQELVLSPLFISNKRYQFSPNDQIKVPINFVACISCPIGFEKYSDEIKGCSCVCNTIIRQYVTNCDDSTEIITKEHTTAWISYITIQNSSNYLVYPYCPLNYCLPPDSKIELNLNIPNGADAQCAHNRSGLLCGTCSPGLSLSLGSSRCLTCSAHWPAVTVSIVIGNLLAGVILVALLLILNLTVAVGTLNGLIFYANIIATNYSAFFPSTSFFTVFIAWLNLELGIDTCFFEGMDAYWKTWIELGFPTYLLLLIIIVIIVCENSIKFAHLVGKKNPVATLDTLILLSYVKFIQLITASYSFAILYYPDNSYRIVWLPDATINYFSGKHIALFLAATLILIVGIFYTFLLFCWQWLLQYQDKKAFIWIRYLRLHVFLEPYHAPYASKHRYWTGLLLLVRIILYVISSVTVSIDPAIKLMVTGILISVLLLLITNRPYISRAIEILEIVSLTNIVCFCLATLYALKVGNGQYAILFVSGSVAFLIFLIIIIYHFLKEVCFKTRIGELLKHQLEYRLKDVRNVEESSGIPQDSEERLPLTFSEVDPPPRDELPLSVLDHVRIRESPKSVVGDECKEKESKVQSIISSNCAPYHLMK